eukprot:6464516-Amphidinium_carterae.1
MSCDVKGRGFQGNGTDADLFVAGFPCQSFSSAGNNKAMDDPRGQIVNAILEWIESKLPKSFILENVKGLAVRHVAVLMEVLSKLRSIGEGNYMVKWKILNSRDYGVPQNRPRLYIIGIAKAEIHCPFTWPKAQRRVGLRSVLDISIRGPRNISRGHSATVKRNLCIAEAKFCKPPIPLRTPQNWAKTLEKCK